MKYILKLTIVVIAFSSHVTNIKAQSYEWLNESASSNRSNYMTLNSNKFILNSRESFSDPVLKIDLDGNEICFKNICNCDTLEVLISAELPNYALIYISRKGEIILTDHFGEYPSQIGKIANLEFNGIRHIEKTDSHIYIRANVGINGNQALSRTSIDLNSLEIRSNVELMNKNLLSFDIDEQNNRIAELFSASNEHIVQIRELDNDEILINEFVVSDDNNIFLYDISFYDETSIVVSGHISEQDDRGGLIKLINYSGLNLWRKVINSNSSTLFIPLRTIFVKDGNILAGGGIGTWLQGITYLVLFNSDGEILWEHRIDLHSGFKDEIDQVIIDDNGDIFANGTSRETDAGSPQRSFVMKISHLNVGLTEFTKGHFEIYPNPSSSILYISGNKEEVRSVTIVNSIGETLFRKNHLDVIDVSNFPNGIYFIIVEIGNEFITRKFTKQ